MSQKNRIFIFFLSVLLVLPFFAQAGENNVFVFRRGNGYGDVVSFQNEKQLLSCGNTCAINVAPGTQLNFIATARPGSVFKGWSVNRDNANSEPVFTDANLKISSLSGNNIVYAKFELEKITANPVIDEADRKVPRVMFWFGKVNQHWDLNTGAWFTDPDGISGARENKLEYCLKFYPDTVKVVYYKEEFTNTWKNAGNTGSYISTKPSYRCVQKGEVISGDDVSDLAEKPNQGSVCYYFPDLPLCLPLSDPRSIKSPFSGQFKLVQFVKTVLRPLKS